VIRVGSEASKAVFLHCHAQRVPSRSHTLISLFPKWVVSPVRPRDLRRHWMDATHRKRVAKKSILYINTVVDVNYLLLPKNQRKIVRNT